MKALGPDDVYAPQPALGTQEYVLAAVERCVKALNAALKKEGGQMTDSNGGGDLRVELAVPWWSMPDVCQVVTQDLYEAGWTGVRIAKTAKRTTAFYLEYGKVHPKKAQVERTKPTPPPIVLKPEIEKMFDEEMNSCPAIAS